MAVAAPLQPAWLLPLFLTHHHHHHRHKEEAAAKFTNQHPPPSVCRSKLENILFTNELQRRAAAAGLDWLTAVSLHPGRVATDIWRTTYFGTDHRGGNGKGNGDNVKSLGIQSIVSDLFYDSILTVEEGANTQVMLAARGEPEGSPVKGQYYDYSMRIKKRMNAFARDEDAARRLWEKSEQLAGMKFRVE